MKKAIFILTLFVSILSNAQDKVASNSLTQEINQTVTLSEDEKKAQKNVDDLNAFVPLNDQTKKKLYQLFKTKYRMFKETDTVEGRKNVSEIIGHKFAYAFDGATLTKIINNKSLYESLLN